ncbi:acetyl-CoA C-acetyltransferase [Bordetella pseudohinzii]|uniref:Acetyl-CoA acetyltransferase n=1 Tax=Bordetella pseudohinzii TaxID=1331258 RepID=A0A0J6C1M8_9BORD|nr:acetyl-CoA C-acetyltransferase [Bordetella pseudohinzii]ANY17156.1 acetyl-CoA acetyltransferase [Bordetella pseudohinzii]KMM24958.1 acetyl-CoA acetyltransferase [Bordetella pseudohinzii]KXA79139.1 acetyl-CoA acetyltransferase [Bordetella pseudohinzii]KXA80247.1 acetyl-CoA acetyltransferase [Bordetella pseudohinzii]CUI98759.1 Beta-ketoadipyl-CoA thiolase [Bordetella pseudohinzii]
MAFEPVYVVDGARSPFLKARTGPGPFAASDLAVQAGRALLLRQPFAPPDLDEVIIGCAAPSPEEVNIGRVIGLRLGCGHRVPGWTVQRNCASGMQALDSAIANIQLGRSQLVLAGGTDALSRAPLLFSDEMAGWLAQWFAARGLGARLALIGKLRPRYLAPVIGLLKGLTDPVVGLSMGQTAENLATRFGIDRAMMDAYSARSHQRVLAAQEAGRLAEIQPLADRQGKLYLADDGVRADSSMEKLARLKPVFDKPFGNVTAGNSSQVSDGAALLLLASEAAVRRWKLRPIGRILDSQWAGLDPAQMGLGPVHAATPILQRHGLALNDLDLWEINEAFAAQVLACLAAWQDEAYCREHLGTPAWGALDPERLNVDGGAIAIGHPVGASGARIVLHLLQALRARGGKRGMAAICIGGGQGGAMLVETLEEA